jgi:hypothetical protein
MTGAGQLLWGVRHGAVTQFMQTVVNQQFTGTIVTRRVLSSLTPGNLYTYRWRHWCTVGSVATFKANAPAGYEAVMSVEPL